MSLWKRGLIGWVAMAAGMTANGIAREVLIKPRASEQTANILSAAMGIIIIQLIARQALQDVKPRSRSEVAALATAWLLMTLGFEFGIGRLVDHKSWQELFADYNLFEGRLWPIVLATVVLAPFIWTASARAPHDPTSRDPQPLRTSSPESP